MTRACETCEWWRYGRAADSQAPSEGVDHGMCKEAPPVSTSDISARWPMTRRQDWCGRWKLKEALGGGRDVRKTA